MTELKWRNISKMNPGFTVYYTQTENGNRYIVQRKLGSAGFPWRTFISTPRQEELRTIYICPKLKDAKEYVQGLEESGTLV